MRRAVRRWPGVGRAEYSSTVGSNKCVMCYIKKERNREASATISKIIKIIQLIN
jgi:hypothetical protein